MAVFKSGSLNVLASPAVSVIPTGTSTPICWTHPLNESGFVFIDMEPIISHLSISYLLFLRSRSDDDRGRGVIGGAGGLILQDLKANRLKRIDRVVDTPETAKDFLVFAPLELHLGFTDARSGGGCGTHGCHGDAGRGKEVRR